MRHTGRAAVVLSLLLTGLVGAGTALAEGLKINDGLWETKMTNPITGERISRECLKDAEFDPGTMMQSQQDCKMTEQTLDGNTLTFNMVCADGSGTAEGRMFTDGDKGGGEMTMQFDMDGQKMDLTMTWDATRVGDC